MSKKYYWLKLKDDFFERDEIKIIESQQNGKDYINFYLKLLLKSVKSDGILKFRDSIPYNPEMLATITNCNIDTVQVAIKMFVELGLMEKWDDGTLFMLETQSMIGSETDSAERKRRQREREKNKSVTLSHKGHSKSQQVTKSHTEIEIDKEIELDKEIEGEIEHTNSSPTLKEIKEFVITQSLAHINPEKFYYHYTTNNWRLANGHKITNWKSLLRKWNAEDAQKQATRSNTHHAAYNSETISERLDRLEGINTEEILDTEEFKDGH
jgi:predicted phage replisome organizer